MNGHRPDIVATKGRKQIIEEVETWGTVGKDRKQHQALRNAAREMGADFKIRVAKKKM